MNTKNLFRSASYILWGIILVWGVAFANNTIYPVISSRFPDVPSYINDIFSTAHLNNLGHYPTGFVLFQVGFSTIVGLAFGYTRVKTGSIYPAIIMHALFNLAATL